MNILKTLALVLGIAAGSLVVCPMDAQAADKHYAMVAIKNTTETKVNYYFRWGEAEWKAYSVEAGSWRWHSWRYNFPNENVSPTPHIKFDEDLSGDIAWRFYDLKAYASPDQEIANAMKYKFVTKVRGKVLDLFTLGN